MKKSPNFSITTVILSVCLCGPSEAEIQSQVFLKELSAGNGAVLDEIELLPADKAEKLLRSAIFEFLPKDAAVSQKAAKHLGALPGIEAVYRRRYEEMVPLIENGNERASFFQILRMIPARWSLNLLGEALSDERTPSTLVTEEEKQFLVAQVGNGTANWYLAAGAMGEMGLKNFPLSLPTHSWRQQVEGKAVQAWWRANQDKPNSFFFYTEPVDGADGKATAAPSISTDAVDSLLQHQAAASLGRLPITPNQYLLWAVAILAGLGAIAFVIKRKSE